MTGQPYGKGVFRRHIRLVAHDGVVSAELEDDFHHVRVRLEHDGERVVRCRGEALRIPWTTCPAAAAALTGLDGMPLVGSLLAVGRHTNQRLHCTHLFDTASLAVVHAALRREEREYRIGIPDRCGGRTEARIARDGETIVAWTIEDQIITAPEPFAARPLFGGGLAQWAEHALDAETAEACLLLQRCCVISMGRMFDMDQVEHAGALPQSPMGLCYTFQPERIGDALRNVGTSRDFSDRPHDLLLR